MNAMLVAGEGSCHVVDAFLTLLKLIWFISSLKIYKVSKNAFLAKSCKSQWVNKKLAFF